MKRFFLLSLAVACLISWSCDESKSPAEKSASITVAFKLSPGSSPTYSWDKGNVSTLTVTRTSDQTPVWGIATFEKNGIVSPVVHGAVPPGVSQTISPEQLVSGVEYEVTVTQINGTFGTGTFTL